MTIKDRTLFSRRCERCKETYEWHSQTRYYRRTFCSAKCYHAATVVHKPKKCLHCKRLFVPQGHGNPHRVYCTRRCYEASRTNQVTKVCPQCKKAFSVNASQAHKYKFCSMKCKRQQMKFVTCRRCGKRFYTSERRYERFYCSEECRRPPRYIRCGTCRKKFRTLPGDSNRSFCSFRCYRRFKGENRLERRVRLAMESIGLKLSKNSRLEDGA
jgi:endogenous inhibitor of DNA gyrase (YacG/DUF329 family)